MNQSLHLKIFILAFLSFGITSCLPFLSSEDISKKDNTIPPEFSGSTAETLLIGSTGKDSYDKKIKKMVDKYYHGPTEFVSYEDLESDKYRDL